MIIKYFTRRVYGKPTLYVANKEQALTISKLTGTKTLFPSHIEALKALGITFVEVIDPIK